MKRVVEIFSLEVSEDAKWLVESYPSKGLFIVNNTEYMLNTGTSILFIETVQSGSLHLETIEEEVEEVKVEPKAEEVSGDFVLKLVALVQGKDSMPKMN